MPRRFNLSSRSHQAYLIFTAGPVQSFVGQARRTRDLWAGSWLLSYLSESALVAAEKSEGTAILPFRDSRSAKAVTSLNKSVGGYPNRFELGFSSLEQAKVAGKAAVLAFQDAWLDLCDQVWSKFVAGAAEKHGLNTREVWDRQVHNYWELSWVAANSKSEAGHHAAARKNFRNTPASPEEGFKCSLMGSHQELSGHYGAGSASRRGRFWAAVRDKATQLDLIDHEHLCAIALVKRLYPKTLPQLRENVPWPSTSFVAALPWLKNLKGEQLRLAQAYADCSREMTIERSESASAKEFGLPWADIDAQVWFKSGIQRNEWELSARDQDSLLEKFKQLQDERKTKPLPYYGLLVMDGDSLGKLLERLGSPTVLSEKLEQFASSVQSIVSKHNGRTIYAGGDDVLAMVAAENALPAAIELSEKYEQCFQGSGAAGLATLSGSLTYAPLHAPFQQLILQGHQVLDIVAKEKTGRNALVIDIVLGSGLSARWSAPWPRILGKSDNLGLQQILGRFQSACERDESGRPVYNASFLYNLRNQFFRLFPGIAPHPGEFMQLGLGHEGSKILADIANAEYRRRLSKEQCRNIGPEETLSQVEDLMWLSRRWSRKEGTGTGSYEIDCDLDSFSFDGWRVARFLQQLNEGNLGDHDGFN